MTHLYSPHRSYDPAVDHAQCRAAVDDGGRRPSFHQCTRKAVTDADAEGARFCRTHDPVAVEARARSRSEEWDAAWKESNRQRKYGTNGEALMTLLLEAKGHITQSWSLCYSDYDEEQEAAVRLLLERIEAAISEWSEAR